MVNLADRAGRAEWASGDVSQFVEWETSTSGDISYHRFYRQTQEQFKENSEIASWGNWYLATRSGNGVSRPVPCHRVSERAI